MPAHHPSDDDVLRLPSRPLRRPTRRREEGRRRGLLRRSRPSLVVDQGRRQTTTNCLFLSFALLSFIVAAINIQFHHKFHDEHVNDKSTSGRVGWRSRRWTTTFCGAIWSWMKEFDDGATQQHEQPQRNGQSDEGHKLAGLRCEEKYGGPADAYAEREMAFWSDIPSDASYRSPFMDETERFLTFEL
mmetsp:Transcript_59331/g.126130  ORF Transcript_59331/g.126130 Transcript_59331/m.126130 type:complete len:187 (+) Transcript_59331:2-562(+)